MRKLVVLLLVVALALMFGALARLRTSLLPYVERAREAVAADGRFVAETGNVGVNLIPVPAVVIHDLVLRPADKEGKPRAKVILRASRTRIVPRLASLLAGGVEPSAVLIEGAHVVIRGEGVNVTPLLTKLCQAEVPVRVRDAVVRLQRDLSDEDAVRIPLLTGETARPGDDGAIPFRVTFAPLGSSSRAEAWGTWNPGVGRTGGDALDVAMRLRDGEIEAFKQAFPVFTNSPLTGKIAIEGTAKGFLGERSTESRPAEPLEGTYSLSVGLDLFGHDGSLSVQGPFAVDDKRYLLRASEAAWRGYQAKLSGWLGRGGGQRIGVLLDELELDVAAVLADFGIAERWRPDAQIDGEIRVGHRLAEPIASYQARIPSVKFDGFEGVPISAGPVKVSGQLRTSNVDVSASFNAEKVRVGHVELPRLGFATTYNRGKVTAMAFGKDIWDGKLDVSFAIEPEGGDGIVGGGQADDLDAAIVLSTLAPEMGFEVDARIDSLFSAKQTPEGFHASGRVGLHYGRLVKPALAHDVLVEIARTLGRPTAEVVSALAKRHPLFAPTGMPFDRAELELLYKNDAVEARIVEVKTKMSRLVGGATLAADDAISGTATLHLAPAVADDLAIALPALEKLRTVSGDDAGALNIAVRFGGTYSAPSVSLDEDFAGAVRASAAGEAVHPYPDGEPGPPLVDPDTTTLLDRYGR